MEREEDVKEPIVEQPSEQEQRVYASLRDDDPTEVRIPRTKKSYMVKWLKNGALVRLSRLLIKKRDSDDKDKDNDTNVDGVLGEVIEDGKLCCKAAAVIVLNDYWLLKLKYWFQWRWFYYIRQYDCEQLRPILEEGKKKVPLIQFFRATMCLTEAKGTLMNMTMREAELIHQGLVSGQGSQTENSSNGSTSPDTSSSEQ